MGLVCYPLRSALYEDELFPSVSHLFEACKLLLDSLDLTDDIRQCERLKEVTSISAGLTDFTLA